MATQAANKFLPDYATSPGEILEETLSARGIKKKEFAERCGLSEKTVSLIIHGKNPVMPATAIQFERVLGVSAAIWNNLEAAYRLHKANSEEEEELVSHQQWARSFPINELVRRGYMEKPSDPADAIRRLLKFFGVGSIQAWEKHYSALDVAYRHSPSFQSAPQAVAAWLRIGDLLSQQIETAPYSKELFLGALREIRSLTELAVEVFEPQMKRLCREAGVALVFVPEFKKTHLSGATRWPTKDRALIILSLRYKRDDHFWFTFFHESAHILLHGKKRLFLDEKDMTGNDAEEEANRWAANFLIPSKAYLSFKESRSFSANWIRSFASVVGIAPGIVVGRLQREGDIPHEWFNGLKRKFEFREANV